MSDISNKNIVKMLRDMADAVEKGGTGGIAFAFSWATTDGKTTSHSHVIVNRNAQLTLRTLLRGEMGNSIRSMDAIEEKYERIERDAPNTATLN